MSMTPSNDLGSTSQSWPTGTFLKIAGLIAGVKVLIVSATIILVAWLGYDSNMQFIEQTMTVKLGEFANEIERRAFPVSRDSSAEPASLNDIPNALILDMSTRFPDPMILVDAEGQVLRTIQPDISLFKNIKMAPLMVTTPANLRDNLRRDRVMVHLSPQYAAGEASWGLAPIYDADARLVGGVLMQPLTNSISQEFRATRNGLISAFLPVIALSIISSLLLSALITRKYVISEDA